VSATRAFSPLERLELQEEESHRRLQAAMARGNPVEIAAAQEFWLRCSETLRRLDLAVKVARRSEEEQISKKLGEDVALYISDWLRIAFAQFPKFRGQAVNGNSGRWRVEGLCDERFRSILHLTVRSSLKTKSPIPDWAAAKVRESWNVQE
jgi:hypothetical protein